LRPVHYLTIVIAIGLIVGLYYGMNTVPSKKDSANSTMAGAGSMQHAMAAPASFDSLQDAARKELPQHAKEEIKTIENQIAAIRDSSSMAASFSSLAKAWQEHKQLQVAAYYHAKAAKLENSPKKLNFAGQLFLELMSHATSESIHVWDADQAIACFQRSLELEPGNDTTKIALASTLIEGKGETMEGVQMLLAITRENPDNVPANITLGRLAIQSGQFDKAIGRFETILKQEPKNTEAMYFLAESYKGKGEKDKAVQLFEECKKLVNNPEFSREIDQYITTFK
jgi:lipopolysaccharide biosynthesis regulator YciM